MRTRATRKGAHSFHTEPGFPEKYHRRCNLDNTLFSGPDHSSPSLKLYFVLENSKI
ncbi:hypothetical protein ACRRTK_005103 [Alexandromys fortis]